MKKKVLRGGKNYRAESLKKGKKFRFGNIQFSQLNLIRFGSLTAEYVIRYVALKGGCSICKPSRLGIRAG